MASPGGQIAENPRRKVPTEERLTMKIFFQANNQAIMRNHAFECHSLLSVA